MGSCAGRDDPAKSDIAKLEESKKKNSAKSSTREEPFGIEGLTNKNIKAVTVEFRKKASEDPPSFGTASIEKNIINERKPQLDAIKLLIGKKKDSIDELMDAYIQIDGNVINVSLSEGLSLGHIEKFEKGEGTYTGQYLSGTTIPHGYGTYEGKEFQLKGQYREGQLYFGTKTNQKDKSVTQGMYKDGKLHGLGSISDSELKLIYKGEFQNGEYFGVGILYQDEQRYEGYFEKGIMNGTINIFKKDKDTYIFDKSVQYKQGYVQDSVQKSAEPKEENKNQTEEDTGKSIEKK